MAIGLAMGVAIGVSTDNLGMWMAIGIAIGAGIDASYGSTSDEEEKTDS